MARTITTHNSGEREMVGEHYSLTRAAIDGRSWVVTYLYAGVRHGQSVNYDEAYRWWCKAEGLPDDVCGECGEAREMGALCMDCYVSALFRQATV